MPRALSLTIGVFTLLLTPLLPQPGARAAGVEMQSYAPLKAVSQEAARARVDLEAVLLNVTVSQARLKKARADAEQMAMRYGEESPDYALAAARLNEVRRETLSTTVDELEKSERRLATAEATTARQIATMTQSSASFQALTRAHLADTRTPEVTALLLHLAIRKLHGRCQELLSRAMVGQLEGDLGELEATLKIIEQLDTSGGVSVSSSLDDIWRELTEGTGDTTYAPGDALERYLQP